VTGGPADQDPEEHEGRLHPLTPVPLTVAAVLGLVGGWLLHPVAERLTGSAPVVTWLQGLVLLFVSAVLGGVAWTTRRTLDGRARRLEPYQAVNRFVLARACALVGAAVAGGYAGYAVSWLGDGSEMAGQRLATSALAAVGGVAVVISALLLERACRVPPDGDAA
jgi:hypothetical protein